MASNDLALRWLRDVPIAPDHPEGICEDCGGPNVSWFAPSSLWNRVVRPDGEQGADPMLCPRCFALRAHRAGVVATWLLETDEDVGPVRMCPDCGQPMTPARKGEDVYLCGNLACVPREDLPIDNATLRAKIIAGPDEPDCFTGPPSTMVEMEWDSAAGMTRYRVVAGHASAEPIRTIEQLTHDIEAFGAGAGAAEPESAEQLAWIEKAKTARIALMGTVGPLLAARAEWEASCRAWKRASDANYETLVAVEKDNAALRAANPPDAERRGEVKAAISKLRESCYLDGREQNGYSERTFAATQTLTPLRSTRNCTRACFARAPISWRTSDRVTADAVSTLRTERLWIKLPTPPREDHND